MKALVLSSGGIDSSTCLALAVDTYGSENVLSLSISYGQKHQKEIEAARAIAAHYHVVHKELDLTSIFLDSDCTLLAGRGDIPHETYADQLEKQEGAPVSTYVPFRNGLFLSSAAAIALAHSCEVIYYGIHADDSAGNAYPDTSPAFNNAICQAIQIGSGNQLKVIAPFVNCNKAQLVETGLKLKVPYELTWSCYEGKEKPCRTCATCIDREKAFILNGVQDPLLMKGDF